MQESNGQTTLDIERKQNELIVTLSSNQYEQANYQKLLPDLDVKSDDNYLILTYPLSDKAVSLENLRQKSDSLLNKLKLAQKLVALVSLQDNFKVPFLHPANIMFEGGKVFAVHFGLKDIIEPKQMTSDQFFVLYRGLVLSIFNPRNQFDRLLSGANTGKAFFNVQINQTKSIEELVQLIDRLTSDEEQKVQSKDLLVKKTRYRLFKYFGIFATLFFIIMGFVTISYYGRVQKEEAVIAAQSYFMNQNYDKAQSTLKNYDVNSLPKSARYVLAASSVNLTDLTSAQKQNILNNLSIKSDNNTLNYWINTGKGKFNDALNLAQNLGDSQLTLLAYTNLYESTKLNTTMNGEQKQKKLDEYSKKIQELTSQLEKQ